MPNIVTNAPPREEVSAVSKTDIEKVLTVFQGIAEHWGFPEKIPPPAEWKNNNGML